jgi:threonyl-tRNA synthetase
MLVVGRKEAESGQVAVRRHGQGDQGSLPAADLRAALLAEIATSLGRA